MVKIEFCDALGRPIRKDPLESLGVSTFTCVREAIVAGRKQEALSLLDYLKWEDKFAQDSTRDWVWAWVTYVADTFGEEELFRLYREATESLRSEQIETPVRSLGVEDQARWWIDAFQGLRAGADQDGSISIVEEADRWVITLDPYGRRGKLRLRDMLDGTPSRAGPPCGFGFTRKARPETWGLSGVSYYCTHCAWVDELTGMDIFGTPNFVTEYSLNPEKPCRLIFYKDSKLIPEAYYIRMGRRRP